MNLNDIQKNIILLSLSNLIEEYTNALEEDQLNQETREFMIIYIHEAKRLIEIMKPNDKTNVISRPSW